MALLFETFTLHSIERKGIKDQFLKVKFRFGFKETVSSAFADGELSLPIPLDASQSVDEVEAAAYEIARSVLREMADLSKRHDHRSLQELHLAPPAG